MKDIKTFLLILGMAFCLSLPSVLSQPYYRDWRGLSPAATTSTNFAASATAQTITLTAPSSRVTINNPAGASIEYINLNGTATTANYAIQPGQTMQYVGFPAIASFSIVSAAAPSGTVSVFAQ